MDCPWILARNVALQPKMSCDAFKKNSSYTNECLDKQTNEITSSYGQFRVVKALRRAAFFAEWRL